MKTANLSIKVQLPKPGDDELERLIEQLADAVYGKVKKRLQEEPEGASARLTFS